MHILVHVLPKTRLIDLEYFVNFIDTCTTENFNCVVLETIKVEVLAWNPSTDMADRPQK